MRRFLIILALVLTPLLLVAAGKLYVDFYAKNDAGLLESTGDFVFMLQSYNMRDTNAAVPPADAADVQRLLKRLAPEKYYEVRDMAAWRLSQLPAGQVVPFIIPLLQTHSHGRMFKSALKILAAHKAPEAAPILAEMLRESDSEKEQSLRLNIAQALGDIGDVRAAPALMDMAQNPKTDDKNWRTSNERLAAYRALAKMGDVGRNFLLQQADKEQDPAALKLLLTPLAMTRSPRTGEFLYQLLDHPDAGVRHGAAEALRALGAAGISPALKAVMRSRDDFVRYDVIKETLTAHKPARDDPRVIPTLAPLLEDFILRDVAANALASMGTPQAAQALKKSSLPAHEIMRHLQDRGAMAHNLLTLFLTDPDPEIQRQAVYTALSLGDTRAQPFVEAMLGAADRRTRRAAQNSIMTLDLLVLADQIINLFPPKAQKHVRGDIRWGMQWGFWNKTETLVLNLARTLHCLLAMFALLIGLLLIFNMGGALESAHFNRLLMFLLAEGFLGDFLLMNHNVLFFRNMLCMHSALLLGFFFMRQEHEPGSTANRLERLGGAGLWVVTPLFLFIGAPLLADALRHAFHQLWFTAAFAGLTFFSLLLVVEQALLPRSLFGRSARAERGVTAAISGSVLGLLAYALGALMLEKLAAGNRDDAILCLLLLAPFPVMLMMLLARIRVFSRPRESPLEFMPPLPEDSLLKPHWDGETVVLQGPGFRAWPALLMLCFPLLFYLPAAWMLAVGEVAGEKTAVFLLITPFCLLGAGATWAILNAVFCTCIIQVKNGFARSGGALFGGMLFPPPWRRHLHLANVPLVLSAGEKAWVRDLMEQGRKQSTAHTSATVHQHIPDPDDFDSDFNSWAILLAVVLTLSAPVSTAAEEKGRPLSDYARLLETGDAAAWPEAIRQLTKKNLPLNAMRPVLKRVHDVPAAERAALAAGFRRRVHVPEVQQALVELAQDDDKTVRDAALKTLAILDGKVLIPLLAKLLSPEHPERTTLLKHLAGRMSSLQVKGMLTQAQEKEFNTLFVPTLLAVARDSDPKVRRAAVGAMGRFSSPLVDEALSIMLQDEDERVRSDAMWTLARRGRKEMFPLLVQKGRGIQRDWNRNKHFETLGWIFSGAFLKQYFELYLSGKTEREKYDAVRLIQAAQKPLTPEMNTVAEQYRGHADAKVRELAQALLDWRPRQKDRVKAGQLLTPGVLLTSLALSALLGLVLFLWAFRMLALRRLVKTTPLSKARSAAPGLAAFHGTAAPASPIAFENDPVIHPFTGEICLLYPGMDREYPNYTFMLQDDSGEIEVESSGAVLLSAERIIMPGEKIYVMGAVKISNTASNRKVLGKDRAPLPLYARIAHFLVRRMLGGGARSSARILFAAPQRVFWMYDNATTPPLTSLKETGFILGAFLLSGAWITLFCAAALAVLNSRFSELLERFFSQVFLSV